MHWQLKTTGQELEQWRNQKHFQQQLSKPFFFLFRHWMAGIHASDALQEALKLNRKHCKALINFLSEHTIDPQTVEHTVQEYEHLVQQLAIEKQKNPGFQCAVSLKPSQFGFDLKTKQPLENQGICAQNLRRVIHKAHLNQIPVEIDMEHSDYTDFTIRFFLQTLGELNKNSPGLRLCLQSNLKRTKNDLEKIIGFARQHDCRIGIRLVKGVYPEKQNPDAFHSETEILQNFLELIEGAFQNSGRLDIAIATHRSDMLQFAQKQSKKNAAEFEIQTLKGIGWKTKQQLVQKRKHYTEYVPYGKDALAYGLRRWKRMLRLTFGSIADHFR